MKDLVPKKENAAEFVFLCSVWFFGSTYSIT